MEQSLHCQKILASILRGFGVRDIDAPTDSNSAKDLLRKVSFDLIILDPGFDKGRGFDILRWMRRQSGLANRFAPAILMIGHSTKSIIEQARDSGGNSVISKPYPPKLLVERIMSLSHDRRPYVEVKDYIGPDRRFKYEISAAAEERRSQQTDES